MATRRPGGRTARTKAAVFEAVAAILAERGTGSITTTEIAGRAGVAATSLYRRWGDVDVLLLEVATARLQADLPLPDTGTLHEDLRTWAGQIAAGLKNPEGSTFFKVLIATAARTDVSGMARAAAMEPRVTEITEMLDRARRRESEYPPLQK